MAEKTILRRRIQAQKIEILNRVHARLGGVQFPPALALPAPLVRSTVGPHDPALTTRGTAQATQPSPAARWSRAARTLVQKGRVRSTCLVVTRSKLNGLTGSLYGALLCAVV